MKSRVGKRRGEEDFMTRRFIQLGAIFCAAWLGTCTFAQSKASSTVPVTAKIDINSASERELNTLPGIGRATAKKIIAGRPYTSVEDLARAGVSRHQIEQITPLVTAGAQPATSSSRAEAQ